MSIRATQIVLLFPLAICLSSCTRRCDRDSVLGARETLLRDDLFTLRRVIDEYTYDKKKALQSLDDLVAEGYIKQIPRDPFTNQADWLTEAEGPSKNTDPNQPGIANVRSRSNLASCDGTTYSTW